MVPDKFVTVIDFYEGHLHINFEFYTYEDLVHRVLLGGIVVEQEP